MVDGDPVLLARLARMTRAGDSFGVSPVVRAEMFAAVWRDRTRRARLFQVLSNLRGDPEISQDGNRAGELLGRLEPRTGRVSVVDGMMAATAERVPALVVTDDASDFSRLRDEAGWRGAFRHY